MFGFYNMEALRATPLIRGLKRGAGPVTEYFQTPRIHQKNVISSGEMLAPLDVPQRNHRNVVIKIVLLDYSDSESRQWGSRALNAASAAARGEGAGSRVARIRNMDMKGKKGDSEVNNPPPTHRTLFFSAVVAVCHQWDESGGAPGPEVRAAVRS